MDFQEYINNQLAKGDSDRPTDIEENLVLLKKELTVGAAVAAVARVSYMQQKMDIARQKIGKSIKPAKPREEEMML